MNVNFTGIHNIRAIEKSKSVNGARGFVGFDVTGEHFENLKQAYETANTDFRDVDNARNVFLETIDVNGTPMFWLNGNILTLRRSNLPIFSFLAKTLEEIRKMPEQLIKISDEFIGSDDYLKMLDFKALDDFAKENSKNLSDVYLYVTSLFKYCMNNPKNIKDGIFDMEKTIDEEISEYIDKYI